LDFATQRLLDGRPLRLGQPYNELFIERVPPSKPNPAWRRRQGRRYARSANRRATQFYLSGNCLVRLPLVGEGRGHREHGLRMSEKTGDRMSWRLDS
jgi:hypothetical protein